MLAKRIIPCLDVHDGVVVKGIQFRNHQVVGDIVERAQHYAREGADELVFYDISAASAGRVVDKGWVKRVSAVLDIPFCVAGGITSVEDAAEIFSHGADKISINSPALAHPDLINQLTARFGSQSLVIGIDSWFEKDQNRLCVYQYTGNEGQSHATDWTVEAWINEVQTRGAGEIVVNVMNEDGMRQGYDINQLARLRSLCHVPLIASGGAGAYHHFRDVFLDAQVDGALAASVFHHELITIPSLKAYLSSQQIEVRQ